MERCHLAQSLTRLGLVGEYRLVVQPVALGDGLPLFVRLTAPFVLDLIEARAYGDSAVLHIYRPVPDERSRIIEAGKVGAEVVRCRESTSYRTSESVLTTS